MRSLLYLVNSNIDTTPAGVIPIGNIVRRYGKAFTLVGNSIAIARPGYYRVSISATVSGDAAGPVGFTLNSNDTPVPGASATETITTATTEVRSMAVTSIIRVFCQAPALLTLTSISAGVFENLAIAIEEA